MVRASFIAIRLFNRLSSNKVFSNKVFSNKSSFIEDFNNLN